MAQKEINCPSCGAPLKLEYRFSKMVVCEYCNQTSHLSGGGLTAKGEKTELADYGSPLYRGGEGIIRKRPFKIHGRIRFAYPDGFWDEWFLQFENDETFYWLQEDEGEYILFRKEEANDNLPVFNKAEVGITYSFQEKQIFVTEKNKATVAGGEGELPHQVVPGEQADFIDGIVQGEGKPVSFEILSYGTLYYTGEILSLDEIEIKPKENVY